MQRKRLSLILAVTLLIAGGVVVAVTQAAGDSSGPVTTGQEGFSYQTPTGPEMTPQAAAETATRYARSAHESGEIHVEVAHGTDGEASAITDSRPPSEPATSNDAPIAAWRASSAYLVVMIGRQFSPSVPLKQGAPAATGSVLTLILDAHTGHLEGIDIGDTAPKIAELGPVTTVTEPGTPQAQAAMLHARNAVRLTQGIIAGVVTVSGGPAHHNPTGNKQPTHAVLVKRGAQTVGVAHTNSSGRFRIQVRTGTYTVRATVGALCVPKTVTVKTEQTARVKLTCGIR